MLHDGSPSMKTFSSPFSYISLFLCHPPCMAAIIWFRPVAQHRCRIHILYIYSNIMLAFLRDIISFYFKHFCFIFLVVHEPLCVQFQQINNISSSNFSVLLLYNISVGLLNVLFHLFFYEFFVKGTVGFSVNVFKIVFS